MKKVLILSVIACCTLSCGLYNKYESASVAVEEGSPSGTVPVWRKVFADPDLSALIDTALVNNATLNVAALRVEEARASLVSSRLGFLPSLNASASSDLRKGAVQGAGQAAWEIDIFGRQLNSVRLAEVSVRKMQDYRQAVYTELVGDVAVFYYTLLSLDAQLSISEQTLESWDKSIAVLESLKLAGKTNDIAVLQARAKKMNLESSVLEIKRQILSTETALCVLMGVKPREIQRGKIESQQFPDEFRTLVFSEGIPAVSLSARPDVRQAEDELAAAFYSTAIARSAFYPTVSISGRLPFDVSAWELLASVAQPVFRHGELVSGLKVAKLKQKEALLGFNQTLLEAAKEVNDAMAACRTAAEKIEIDKAQRDALGSAVSKIELMMRYSTTNYLEVLTAQQSLLNAEMSLVSDRLALLMGYISLYKSVGGAGAAIE